MTVDGEAFDESGEFLWALGDASSFDEEVVLFLVEVEFVVVGESFVAAEVSFVVGGEEVFFDP